LNSTRGKRWNGKFDSLPADFLNAIAEKMADYGDRVQFSMSSSGPKPSYQVMNAHDKKIAFDSNHHLMSPQGYEFSGEDSSAIFTLDQIKAMINGTGAGPDSGKTARPVRASRGTGRTSAAKLNEQFAAQRYEYFKNNRQMLPPSISDHSGEITALMMQGKSVEEAFDEVLKKHF
jgi:hypothetical protein